MLLGDKTMYSRVDELTNTIYISGSSIEMEKAASQLEALDFNKVGEYTWKFDYFDSTVFNWVLLQTMNIFKPTPISKELEELCSMTIKHVESDFSLGSASFVDKHADRVIAACRGDEPVMISRTKGELKERIRAHRGR